MSSSSLSPELSDLAAIGHLSACRREFKRGADINKRDHLIGLTALHRASLGNHLKVTMYLILNGANVNAEDRSGKTALHWASAKGHLEVAEELVKHGAELDIQDELGFTAFHSACRGGHLLMARYLKSCGCNVNLQNTLYSTALHGACLAGQLNIVMFLIEIRADIDIEDNHGKTPIECASECGNHEIAMYLYRAAEKLSYSISYSLRPLQPSISAEEKMSFSRAIQRQTNEHVSRQSYDIFGSIFDRKSTPNEQSKECLHELSDDDQYDNDVFLDYVPAPKLLIAQKPVEPKRNSKVKKVSVLWNVPNAIDPVSEIQERASDVIQKLPSTSMGLSTAHTAMDIEISKHPVSEIQECMPNAIDKLPSMSKASLTANTGKDIEINEPPMTFPRNRVMHRVAMIENQIKEPAVTKIPPVCTTRVELDIEVVQENTEEIEEKSVSIEEESSLEIDPMQGDLNETQLRFREQMAAAARCARMKWEEDNARALKLESLSRKREEEAVEMRRLVLLRERELRLLHDAECDRQLREFDATQKREERERLDRASEERERILMQIEEDEQRRDLELLRQLEDQKGVHEQESLLVEILEEQRQDEFSTLERERIVYDNGDIYEGFIDEQGKPHGNGSMVYSNGDSYKGEFDHGLRDGWGVHTQELLKTIFHGYQSAGRRCSFGRIEQEDGYIYEGAWLNDKMHGDGKEIWPDGEEYCGSYHLGVKQGFGVYKYASGHVYEGDFLVGEKHGVGVCTWPNGDVYSGGYKNGLRHGKGSYVSICGWVYVGDWRNDHEHGMGKQSYVRSGRLIFHGKWSKGKPCLRR